MGYKPGRESTGRGGSLSLACSNPGLGTPLPSHFLLLSVLGSVAMRTVRLSWPAMAIVLLALFFCLGALVVDADKRKPEEKFDPVRELSRRNQELNRIRNEIARLRYGKRDIREADVSRLLFPDLHGTSVGAVLRKLLYPDKQDTSFKSRPEGTYIW